MTDIRELSALMMELLAVVDVRTGVPKFPARATEIVKEISAYAKTTRFYAEHTNEAEAFFDENAKPEEIWVTMLQKIVHAPTSIHIDGAIIGHMPALEKALDAQRRCRVCGCTDGNACPGGCYWVEKDLCSECAQETTDVAIRRGEVESRG